MRCAAKDHLARTPTLSHKSTDGWSSLFPRRIYPAAFVTGMPRAVWPFRTAMRTCTSATWRWKLRAMRRWPSSFMQCIRCPAVICPQNTRGFVSTRLRRWYRLQFRQSARPRYFDARTASFLAMSPAPPGFHGWAFLRGGMTAVTPRSAPLMHVNMHCRAVDSIMASTRVVCSICGHAANLLFGRDLVEPMR